MKMLSNTIIEVENLRKSYNGIVAVDGISLGIAGGSCFGLLGPNGAGKTTTVEMMENILSPDAGKIRYRGRERDQTFNQEVGIQFQHTELLAYLTVEETLKTFSAFYETSLPIDEVLSLCMLEKIGKQMNNKISGGQRQRLLLGLALHAWKRRPTIERQRHSQTAARHIDPHHVDRQHIQGQPDQRERHQTGERTGGYHPAHGDGCAIHVQPLQGQGLT